MAEITDVTTEEVKRPPDQFIDGRRKLPKRRVNRTFKMKIGRSSFFFNVGYFSDWKPAEIFIDNMKTGSDINDTVNFIAILCSLALQYGCPDKKIIESCRSFKDGSIPKVISNLLEEAVSEEAILTPYKTAATEEIPTPVQAPPPPLIEKIMLKKGKSRVVSPLYVPEDKIDEKTNT